MGLLDDSQEFALLLIYILTTLAAVATILRFYGRLVIVKGFGLDDKLAVGFLLGNTIVAIMGICVLNYGGGTPFMQLTLEQFGNILKLMFAMVPFQHITVCCIQLSYLAFYSRFLVDKARGVLIFLGVFVLVQQITFVCLFMFRCHPISNVWDPMKVADPSCVSWPVLLIAHSATNIACDLTIYLLPLPSLFRLQVSNRRKLGLFVLFAVGFIALGASVYRLRAVVLFYVGGEHGSAFASINAATIEYNLAIIVASVPGMKPIFMKAFELKLSNPGTFRMSLNTIVYPQSAPSRLESTTSPFSSSDVAFRVAASDPGTQTRGSCDGDVERLRPPY